MTVTIIKVNLFIGTLFLCLLSNLAISDETDNSAVMSQQDIQEKIKSLQKKLENRSKLLNTENTKTSEETENTVTKHLSLTQNIKKLVNENANQKNLDLRTESMKLRASLKKQFSYLSQREIDVLVEKFEDNRLEGITGAATDDISLITQVLYEPTEGQGYKPKTSKQVDKITTFLSKNKNQTEQSQVNPILEKEGNTTITELVIEKGDTLSDIAKRNYGNANMYMPIFMSNQDKLETPHFVPEGIKLKIPTIKNIQNWKDYPDTFKKKIARKKKIKKLKKKSIAKKKIIRKKKIAKKKVEKEIKKSQQKSTKPLFNNNMEEVARRVLEGKF